MTLPTRNSKHYLHVIDTLSGCTILALEQHAAELEALFGQRGLSCRREADVHPGTDALRFYNEADRAKVREVLESYKQAKGS